MTFDFYKSKRSELIKAHTVSKGAALHEELEKAIKLTDFSVLKCKQLRYVSQRGLDFYLAENDKSKPQEIATFENWVHSIAEYTIPEATEIDKIFKNQFNKDFANILCKMPNLDPEILDKEKLTDFLKNNSTELFLTVHIGGLYLYIFKPKPSKFDRRTILNFFIFLAGLVPVVGPFVSGIVTIEQIINKENEELKSADRYLTYLHQYVQSLKDWCGVTDEIIANFETVHRDSVDSYFRLTKGLSRTH